MTEEAQATPTHVFAVNVKALSDDELALATTEYVERAMRLARSLGHEGKIRVAIAAEQYAQNCDYTINHGVSVDDSSYAPLINSENCISAMGIAVERLHVDKDIAPVVRHSMLADGTAKEVEPDDDVPF